MTKIRTTFVCSGDELAARRTARDDIVAESPDGADRWELEHGPFQNYERTLRVKRRDDGDFDVEETTTYRLAIPVWAWLFHMPVKRAIKRRQNDFSYWWAPPDRLDASASTVLGLLCAVQIVDG